jgi:RNA polymerase sigma-70 factor (ECF subfamily)
MVSQVPLLQPAGSPTITADEACLDAFQRELAYVYRTLRRLGTAPADLDDLAQESFVALRGAWSAVDQTRPLRPYLFGIAFRISAAHHRKRRREVAFGEMEIMDGAPSAEGLLAAKRSRTIVLAALEHIPLPRRAALVMHDIDGVSARQVARVLGIPRFTVYSRLRKARVELERIVRRRMNGIGD